MREYQRILETDLLFSILILIFGVALAIGALLYKGPIIAVNEEKHKSGPTIVNFILKRIVPVIVLVCSVWSSYSTILDYTICDFQSGQGYITKFATKYKNPTATIYINEKMYFIPRGMFMELDMEDDSLYRFVYTVRGKLILEIEEIDEKK